MLVPRLYLSQNKTSAFSPVDCRGQTDGQRKAGGSSPRLQLLPHGSVVVVHVVDFVTVLPVVLVPHGVLVHGGVGLGRGVEGGRDAVTGLAAVVAVPVVHGAVRVLVWPHGDTVNQTAQSWLLFFQNFSKFKKCNRIIVR